MAQTIGCKYSVVSDESTREYYQLKDRLLVAMGDKLSDSAEAVISHFLHAPGTTIPGLSVPLHRRLLEAVYSITDSEVSRSNLVREVSPPYQSTLPVDWSNVPFPPPQLAEFRFIDLFAGIGGFRIAMQEAGGKCCFSSEWDESARLTYESNFGEVPFGDIRSINEQDVPKHEVLCAGFPCQPFSLAGVSARNSRSTAHGFDCEIQGTLFFDIARIMAEKRPAVVFLENVKNLVSHDNGRTFGTIRATIESLGYSFSYKLIDSSPLVPQRRVRCYMVCLRDDKRGFEFPEFEGEPLSLRTILEKKVSDEYTISSKLWEGHQRRTQRNLDRGTGFTAYCADLDKPSNTIVARYGKDGKECLIPQRGKNPRMLTPRECARLQGFPEEFVISVARTTAYRQFGNSVAVPVVRKIAHSIADTLNALSENPE